MERKRLDEKLYYLGRAPEDGEKVIFIHHTRKVDDEVLPKLFQFALEAYSSGYTLLVNSSSNIMETLTEAAFILDKPLYVMVNDGLERFRLYGYRNTVMLTRGGFLSPLDTAPDNHVQNMIRARILSVEISHATLILDNDYQDMARESLDMGHDIAVLRDLMEDKGIRMLVKEGAPVLDSFQNWLEMPRAISFEMDNGPFREPKTGKRYSVIIL